jgi:hypothetical protein
LCEEGDSNPLPLKSVYEQYEAAICWYDERSDVGPAFVAAIKGAITRIRRSPRAFTRWRAIEQHDVRREQGE